MNRRTAFITGGGRGIGQALAIEFARAGYDVGVTARSSAELGRTRQMVEALGPRCVAFTCDLSDPGTAAEAVGEAQRQLERIDVLVNNAATAPLAPIEQCTPEQFDAVFALNVGAVVAACRAVWPLMKSQGGGTIINISSVAARDPFPGFALYGASKAAVNGLTTALAAEGRAHGIRVFALCPGAVETAMLRAAFPDLPAERCLQPRDVAEVAVLLADGRSRYASGAHLYLEK